METGDLLSMCAQTACGRLRYLSHRKAPEIAFYYNLGEISHSPTPTPTPHPNPHPIHPFAHPNPMSTFSWI